MSFQDIIGHENIVMTLESSLKEEKTGHAYLFTGPAGIGKKTLAHAFANALLCHGNGGALECPCQSCRQVRLGSHPDLVTVTPSGNSIKIEQLRELQRTLFLRPLLGKRKVFIFPEAEQLTEVAANSFLKLLEEPPPGIVFLFTAVRPDHILATIRSRCQIFQLFPVASEQIAAWLLKKGYAADTARQKAADCQGAPGLALDQTGPSDLREVINLEETLQLDLLNLLKLSGDFEKKERQEILQMVKDWEIETRHHLLQLGRTEPAALERKAGRRFVWILEKLTQVRAMIENNVSQRLVLDQFFMASKFWEYEETDK